MDWLLGNVPKYATSRAAAVKFGQGILPFFFSVFLTIVVELMNKGLVHSSSQQPFADGEDFYFFQVCCYCTLRNTILIVNYSDQFRLDI